MAQPEETELERVEKKFGSLVEFVESVMNCATNAIFVIDLNGNFRLLNPAASQMTGYSDEELIGKSFAVLLDPESQIKIDECMRRVVSEGAEIHSRQLRLTRKNGEELDVIYNALPLREGAHVVSVVGTAEDITEKNRFVRDLERVRKQVQEVSQELREKAALTEDSSREELHGLKVQEETLRRSERQLRLVTDNLPLLTLYVDTAQRIRFVNRKVEHWMGRQRDDFIGRSLEEVIGSAAYERIRGHFEQALSRSTLTFEGTLHSTWGETRWVAFQLVPDLDEENQVRGLFASLRDITDQRKKEQTAAERTLRLQLINRIATRVRLGTSVEEIIGSVLTDLSQAFPDLDLAYSAVDEAGGIKCLSSRGYPEGTSLDFDLSLAPKYMELLRQGKIAVVYDVLGENWISGLAPHLQAAQIRAFIDAPIFVSGHRIELLSFRSKNPAQWSYHEIQTLMEVQQYLGGAIQDAHTLEQQKRAEETLAWQANYDSLTNLPNRRLFQDRLPKVLSQARRNSRTFAVLWIDLDNFKSVNDNLGHEAGDRLLQEVSRRFSRCLRDSDTLARIGGDEFAVLLPEISQPEGASSVAEKILAVFQSPFVIDSRRFNVSASIGISLYPNDGQDPATLMRNADLAMYKAKHKGKNTYQHFSPSIAARAAERAALAAQLRNALANEEFVLSYQPIMTATEPGELTGFNVVLNWNHPKLGPVAAEQFLALSADKGFLDSLTEWVLRNVCMQLKTWEGQGLTPVPVKIRFPDDYLARESGLGNFLQILSTVGVNPRLLMVEVTEIAVLELSEGIEENLEEIASLGVKLVISDFGMGHSSLLSLRQLPLFGIEIGRRIVQCLPDDQDAAMITRAIVSMAHDLKLQVIASGVETQQQARFLADSHCNYVSGCFLCSPVSNETAARLLKR